jgi:hypothetical protein
MAQQPIDPSRQELEDEYRTWAQICLDKHGMPWPVKESELSSASDSHLTLEIKKLKVLGRTPHE